MCCLRDFRAISSCEVLDWGRPGRYGANDSRNQPLEHGDEMVCKTLRERRIPYHMAQRQVMYAE